MCGWLIIGILCPPLLPFIILFGLLEAGLGGGGGGYLPPAPSPPVPPEPPLLPPPVDPFLFRPLTRETDDSFIPKVLNGVGEEEPGALCLVCGAPKATGDHAHEAV